MRMIPREERNSLMKEANFHINVSPEEGLAMKADLCLPWKKLRIMRRWMKSWSINVAGERKQRQLMKQDLEKIPVEAENVPFAFSTRCKQIGQELRPAPLAFISDLKSLIFHLLEEKDRLKQLTWHNGLIPSDEIWIKIGGDKGGSSFKASLQVVNVDKPNSVKNSCVFAIFEAPDSYTNLHIALDRYRE
jgi:hypothetical protein